MVRKEFQEIAEAIKDIPDDVKAWEQACNLIPKIFNIKEDTINHCKSEAEYIRQVYRRAYNIEQVVHVMATVPVYLIVRNFNIDTQMIVTIFNEEQPTPFIPVFFSEEQARKEMEYIDFPRNAASVVRIPLFLLIDGNYGFFPDNETPKRIALFDDRDNKPIIYFDKFQVLSMLMDSTKTLRSRFEADIGIRVVPRKPVQMEDNSDQGPFESPMPPFHGIKKPPVS